MAKAIKHIRAGLLHIEVIGTVPDDGARRKPRAGRGRPTCAAQQFYNAKLSWRELELMIAANFGSKDWFVTYTYDNEHLPGSKEEAANFLQKHFRSVRDVRRRREQELKYIYVTEGLHGRREDEYFGGDGALEDRRFHHHVIINSVSDSDLEELRSLWKGGGYIKAEPIDIHYYQELAKYMTKEAREFGRAKPGERTWRGSRNLIKYEVDYIEIPSDSVTLSAPSDAVDYRSFSEKNPYGFADCIGARYLMFPVEPEQRYSYTAGRTRRRSP